jgi:APA family basic amino acid/polyamine antiporter
MSRPPGTEPRGAVRRRVDRATRLDASAGLPRGLGSPALFGIVQAFVAASLYFSLGLVAERAQGLTWLVFGGAGLFFALLALSYVEGTSMHRERGGAAMLARYAFNELWSFVAGWAILLDYLILVALCAFAVTDYAAVFWSPLESGALEFVLAAGVVAYVAVASIRGEGPRRYERAALLVIADLVVQVVLVALGLALLFEPAVLSDPASLGGSPSASDLLFAFTLAVVAFSGLDAASGLAGEVTIAPSGLKRLLALRIPTFVPYLGLALVASSVLPERIRSPGEGPDPVEAPVIAVVGAFETAWLRETLTYVVAASAIAVLVIVCNAAMLGLSRLGYSLALNRQIPASLGRLHPRRSTPFVLITLAAVLAIALIVPADLELLAGIYAFGATLAFTLVHLSICVLRYREPTRPRPYKIPLNLRVGGGELPLPAALGALVSMIAFGIVLALHSGARIVGTVWLAAGVVLYLLYRTSEDKPVFRRVTVPERALLGRDEDEGVYGSILVPISGTPLDDDIMQTAGRLAGEENEDEGEGGAVIEALWGFEVPMALPLDAAIPDEQLRRARAALARAKAVGEEYEGVEVATATVRARRAGEAIAREARRRGVEAIVLAAEEPTRQRGGLLLGGKHGLRDTFVGETTRYVITKAPCRVILTAPPADPEAIPEDPAAPTSEADAAAEAPVEAGVRADWDGSYGPVPPGVPVPEGARRLRLPDVLRRERRDGR